MKTVQYLAYPRLTADQLNLNQVKTGATKSDLEPSVSTTDTQQNIEPPYLDIAKLTVMDDTVKRKLFSSKWNDSHIFKFPDRYI